MNSRVALIAVALLLTISGAHGQPAHQHVAEPSAQVSSFTAAQLADLRAGRGMGLAIAAEQNGYPGPSHVLEHAEGMGLTADQRERTLALFTEMKAEAVELGTRLIEQESALDRLFASKAITRGNLADLTAAIGATQAALRAAHLRYHLVMMDVLTTEQVRRYGELRRIAAR